MAMTWARNGFWALLLLLAGAAVSYVLLVSKPAPAPEAPPAFSPPAVEVVGAVPGLQALRVDSQGPGRPLREIKLVAQVGGRVESVAPRFAEGGFFTAGEQLVKVEDTDYRFAIARAESQLAAARQRLAEERGRALQAKREWRDLGTEQANALFLRKPQIAAAEAALRASEADLADAQLDLKRTSISVPFNGRISGKEVDIGQYVAPGAVIASVYDTEVAQVRLPLTGRQVALLDLPLDYEDQRPEGAEGAAVVLRARFANRLWEWQGRIVRTDASIDENSRVVYAVAEVQKPFAREAGSERPPLSPGLFVNATISGRELSGVSLLPRSALVRSGTVMVVDGTQRVRERDVEVLQSDAKQLWVQGLERGERVIVRDPAMAIAGTEVLVNTVAGLASGGS